MKEHRTEVEQNEKRKFTRSTKRTADEEQSKSAITDHTRRENHVINWDEAKILDKESDRIVDQRSDQDAEREDNNESSLWFLPAEPHVRHCLDFRQN